MRVGLLTCSLLLAGAGCAAAPARTPPPASGPAMTEERPVAPPAPPFPMHSMGLSRIALLNYPYWEGREAYLAAATAAGRQEWSEAELGCRQVLDVNPDHAAARRLLASALAMQTKHEEAAEQLGLALSDDWVAWGHGLARDPTLATFRESPSGQRFAGLVASYEAQFAAIRRRSLWVVGRRAPYAAPPTNRGARFDVTRAEVLLYDPLEGRFHRVTHTDESVLGARHLADGDLVAVSSNKSVPAATHWQLESPRILRLAGDTLAPRGEPATFPGAVGRLAVREGADGELAVVAWTGQDGAEGAQSYRLEGSTFVRTDAPAEVRPGDLAVSHWHSTLEPDASPLRCAAATCARADGASVTLPGQPTATYPSPDEKWAAVVVADPTCSNRESTLLLVALTGNAEVREVHKGEDTFHRVRWLDAERLAFEADAQSLVEYDLSAGKTGFVVRNPAGIALDGLGIQDGPCDPQLAPKLAAVAGDWIRILENVEFAFDSAELLPESYPLLDDVAEVLRFHPDITRLEIQGHADRHASPEYNLRLSQERAEAVRHDLVMRGGIAEHRLVARGYGKSRPLDRSTTEDADAKNRRVSFKILARELAK